MTTTSRAAVGDITYTQALNQRGGIESDFTVTRVEDDAFLVVTGTAFGIARPGVAAPAGPPPRPPTYASTT